MYASTFMLVSRNIDRVDAIASKCGSRGGDRGPDPPPLQVIWVSIGNKQLDPSPGKSWTPPPPPENVGLPLEPETMIDFFKIDHLLL